MAQEDKFIVPQRKPAVGKSTVVSGAAARHHAGEAGGRSVQNRPFPQ